MAVTTCYIVIISPTFIIIVKSQSKTKKNKEKYIIYAFYLETMPPEGPLSHSVYKMSIHIFYLALPVLGGTEQARGYVWRAHLH